MVQPFRRLCTKILVFMCSMKLWSYFAGSINHICSFVCTFENNWKPTLLMCLPWSWVFSVVFYVVLPCLPKTSGKHVPESKSSSWIESVFCSDFLQFCLESFCCVLLSLFQIISCSDFSRYMVFIYLDIMYIQMRSKIHCLEKTERFII